MPTIHHYLASDHHRCDDYFSIAEEMVVKGKWDAAQVGFMQFSAAMAHHFGMEEQVLFPAFERVTGNAVGPTLMMRREHAQMRELIANLDSAVMARDADEYVGLSETLLILLQQHNLKEEQVLYPMSDQLLNQTVDELLEQMSAVPDHAG
ncbi:MAG: hemerythrin domain-containing protein [Burkholderiales bacterium]